MDLERYIGTERACFRDFEPKRPLTLVMIRKLTLG